LGPQARNTALAVTARATGIWGRTVTGKPWDAKHYKKLCSEVGLSANLKSDQRGGESFATEDGKGGGREDVDSKFWGCPPGKGANYEKRWRTVKSSPR